MTLATLSTPFVPIMALNGYGLSGGQVYIGVDGEDPQTNPQAVYWDAAGMDPASQPLAVTGGYITRTGTPAQAFTAVGNYSMRVLDSNNAQVFYQSSVTGPAPTNTFMNVSGSNVSMTHGQALAFKTATNTTGLVGVCPEDYGAVGDGSANDTAALVAAIGSGKNVVFPDPSKTYMFTGNLTLSTDDQYFGGGATLKPIGAVGIIASDCTGAEIEVVMNSPGHTGTAISVIGADRVRIKKLLGNDIFNHLCSKIQPHLY